MTIISVAGLMGSGKDTLADYLISHHSFKKMSFASSLKDAISVIFGWDRNLLEGDTLESRAWREAIDDWWSNRLRIPNLTPRWVLQHWGTEVVRGNFHDEMWIASLEHKLLTNTDNIVITDCRFENEMKAITNVGGISIRVERGERPAWYDYAITYSLGPDNNPDWEEAVNVLTFLGVHASEYSGVGLEYKYIIRNDSTVEELYRRLENIICQQSNLLVSR